MASPTGPEPRHRELRWQTGLGGQRVTALGSILMQALNNSATLVPFSLPGLQFPDLEEGAVMPPPAQECCENMK